MRAVPLHFISATEMEKLLKPYARANAIVDADAARNLIVLAGTREELANYLRTIQIFDVDWLAGMSVGVFPLQQTDATHMVTELETAFGANSKTPVAGMFRFMPLEGVNAVLVITPQAKYLNEIQTWIDRLDAGDGQTSRLYVYEVKNVKASDLSTQIGTLFGIQVAAACHACAIDDAGPGDGRSQQLRFRQGRCQPEPLSAYRRRCS